MKKTSLIFFILFGLFTSCDYPSQNKKTVVAETPIGYNLTAPDEIYVLPKALQEVSGIIEIDSTNIACIQDEREIVFIYDLNKSRIVTQMNYGYSGDYEGIARVGTTLYILRSDGEITEILNYDSEKFKRSVYTTGIPLKDNEGICYDERNNRLLITPKETPGKDSGNKDKRFIYGFDLISKTLITAPVFSIDLSVIESFALENNIKVPMKEKKKGKKKEPDIKFLISDIAIHPITGRLFMLSSVDKLLVALNMNNEIEYMERLNPGLFNQPEGITFMKNGDMYISNEGKKKPPTLLRFKYKPSEGELSN